MEYYTLFFTQSGAIKYSRFLAQRGINCELVPVPRKLSSGCGIAAKFQYHGDVRMLINDDVERIYRRNGEEYTLAYETKE